MRTLPVALVVVACATTAYAQQPPRSFGSMIRAVPARCDPTAGIVGYRGKPATPRKLGEMPPASQIYAVYNVVDGCPQPVVVRKGTGGDRPKAEPLLRVPPRATHAR